VNTKVTKDTKGVRVAQESFDQLSYTNTAALRTLVTFVTFVFNPVLFGLSPSSP